MFHFIPPYPFHAVLMAAVVAAPQGPLDVEVVRSETAPTVLLHRQGGPLVALRMSAAVDPALPEGSMELLQELARPRLREEVARLGARLELRHEQGHAVVALTGPVEAFDALAAVIGHAATSPSLDIATLRQARARAESRVLARLEQPAPRVERLLRSALEGAPPPTGFAAGSLGPDAVRLIRDRAYDRSVVRLVVVGDVAPERVRVAFAEWPIAHGPIRPVPVPDTAQARARPQAHRERVGMGLPVEADPAILETAAELIRGRLEPASPGGVAAEVWRIGGTTALAMMALAAPDSGAADAVLLGGVEAAARSPDPAVFEAGRRVRNRLLLAARTVAGRAEVIGRLADRDDRADAAAGLLRGLAAVQPPDVRSALERAGTAEPVRVEAIP